MRLISTINRSLGYQAKVYKDTEWGEYRVKFYDTDKYHLDTLDYHTDDKQDAIDTAHKVLDNFVSLDNQ